MAVKTNFPLVIPENTIDVTDLESTFPGFPAVDAFPGTGYGQTDYAPVMVGGVVPKNSSGFPPSFSDMATMPVILGQPGQLYSISGNPLPPRPAQGSALFPEITGIFDPPLYFGKALTPLKVPLCVISASKFNDIDVGSTAPTSVTTFLNDLGITFLGISPATGGTSGYALLQSFPVATEFYSGITQIFGAGAKIDDFTIDPTCFFGGKLLSISWHWASMPYTLNTTSNRVNTPLFSGPVTEFDAPGPDPINITVTADGLLSNHITQVNAAIGTLVKFRHVFVVDPNSSFNTYPSWDAILGSLTQPWMEVVNADLTDPSTPLTVIEALVADFFD